ncbi:hypothetical protein ABG768_013597 [Culter alburnus]|uniref:Ig-like domain-containing protein n=1 Tax=Culter alburnus TaxID=194366 RepID=A0AAW2B315_CULAL
MAVYAKTKIFYTSIWILLILGVECFIGGFHHVLTIKTGGSVTIPCHYDEKNPLQKKYWYSEIDQSNIYTNTSQENPSVIDHPDQSLFTVTMRNLQDEDTGDYSCVVETEGLSTIRYDLHLRVQFAPDVSVVSSSVSGHEGGNVSVQCFYSSIYQNQPKQWCRYKDESCYTVGRTDTSQNSSVQISDDGRSSFTVLMTGLRLSDSGWFYCSAGEAMNPVHLTVIEAKKVNEATDNQTDLNKELLTVWLLVSAALLLLLILVGVFFTWRWKQRSKQDKHQNRERNDSRTSDAIYSKPEDPVIYNTINDECSNDITYSTVGDAPGSEALHTNSNSENNTGTDTSDHQSIFTVRWDRLETSDSGYYWCAVEIAPDVSVVNSSVSGHEGGNVSVQCFYSSRYKYELKQWCRYKDQRCYTVTDTSQNPSLQISDDDGRRSFTVLMTGLRLSDSGWYLCSVGDLQVPVQLIVNEPKLAVTNRPITTPSDSETDMFTTQSSANRNPTSPNKIVNIVTNTASIPETHIDETKPSLIAATETNTTEMRSQDEQNNYLRHDGILLMSLVAMLVLLLLVSLVVIVTWRLRKKPKRGHIREEEHFNSTSNASSAAVDDNSVLYSSVIFNKAVSVVFECSECVTQSICPIHVCK